jgi:hypothetical protein
MIVLRQKKDRKAINVSYTEVGALYSTDTRGRFVAFIDAKVKYVPNSKFVQIEGDTRLSPDYLLEEFVPILFFSNENYLEMRELITLGKNGKLSKTDSFRLKDLKRLASLQEAEKAISVKARRLNFSSKHFVTE